LELKVGVVGVGYLGQHHARIYSELEGAELVAVSDTDGARAEEIAGRFGCRAVKDYRDMLEGVEALSIVTPTSTHYEVALECLKAGKDLLIEKPVTATVDEADSLIKEVEKRGAIVQVGHLERYNPGVVAVMGLVDEPVFIESERVAPFVNRALDVDVTVDLMIHDIDIVMSILGVSGVKDVRVVGARVLTDKYDVAKAWVEFEGGATALITASRISRIKQRLLKIYQKDSFLMLDYQKMRIRRFYRSGGAIESDSVKVESREPLRDEIEDFIDCVRERRRPKVSATEGRNALEVALEITRRIR
jgi:predicted dehydrogenase